MSWLLQLTGIIHPRSVAIQVLILTMHVPHLVQGALAIKAREFMAAIVESGDSQHLT